MRVPQQSGEIAPDQSKVALRRWLLVSGLLCVALGGVGAAMTGTVAVIPESDSESTTEHAAVLDRESISPAEAERSTMKFAVFIRRPSGPPRVAIGISDLHGNEVAAACSACHATRQPNHQNRVAKDLDEFHRGMAFSHGTVSCLSCHNDQDYDALRRADGSRVEFADVMTLCAQCHGPQMTAYEHGAHGGMTGYWDLDRGPQLKNHCIDCHDPHAPQFPKMQPTFKPHDRFLDQPRTEH
ncbi:hypothetical protein OAS39_05990 [Pirellulales bacterium]|nr:hypothetical protein [Pirellulales bacterium]